MKRTKRYFVVLYIMMALAILCLTGCGSSKTTEKVSSTPIATATPTTEPMVTSKPEPTTTPTQIPTPMPEVISVTVFTSTNHHRNIYFHTIDDAEYLHVDSSSVWSGNSLDDKIDVSLYTADVSEFDGFRIDKAENEPLKDEQVQIFDYEGNDITERGVELSDILMKGGAIKITNMEWNTIYRLTIYANGGTYATFVKMY